MGYSDWTPETRTYFQLIEGDKDLDLIAEQILAGTDVFDYADLLEADYSESVSALIEGEDSIYSVETHLAIGSADRIDWRGIAAAQYAELWTQAVRDPAEPDHWMPSYLPDVDQITVKRVACDSEFWQWVYVATLGDDLGEVELNLTRHDNDRDARHYTAARLAELVDRYLQFPTAGVRQKLQSDDIIHSITFKRKGGI